MQNDLRKRSYGTRRVSERCMLFGYHSVIEAIEAGKVLDKVLIRRDMRSAIGEDLKRRLSETGTPVQKVPVEKLDQFTDKNHQGVIAFISPIEFCPVEEVIQSCYDAGEMPFVVVLDGITDVRNLGAIARTCECAGVHALLVPNKHCASINSDAIKTSSGALLSLPVCRTDDLDKTLQYLKDSGVQILAATEHSEQLYTECDLKRPVALLLGNEEIGISPERLHLSDAQIRIPMFGKIESLNVSVAAGIFIYEAVRQRSVSSR